MHACLLSPNVGLWFKHQAYARVITIMASVGLGELLERQRRVDIELASVRAAVVKARRAARASSAPANRTWRLVGGLRNAIVLAYALAGYRVEAAAVLLKRRAAKARWPPKADMEIVRMIEDCFLDFDVYELAALREADATSDPAALREASQAVVEWQVSAWVATQNRSGVAVPSSRVVGEFASRHAATQVELAAWGPMGSGSTRMRLHRWRKRYGGRVGVLRPREVPPHAEMVAKANRTGLELLLFGNENAPSDGRDRVPWSRPSGGAARILDVLRSCPQYP